MGPNGQEGGIPGNHHEAERRTTPTRANGVAAVAKSVACGLIMANWWCGVAAIVTANTANTANTSTTATSNATSNATADATAATRCCYCERSVPAVLAPEWLQRPEGVPEGRLRRGWSEPTRWSLPQKQVPTMLAHPRPRSERAGVRAQAPTLRHLDALLQ